MRVFQSSYRDKDPPKRLHKTKRWYIDFRDHQGCRQRVSGVSDKKTTESMGRNIERLVNLKICGEPLDSALTNWLETLLPRVRSRLSHIGLLNASTMAALRPLAEHLDGASEGPGWRQVLAARGNTSGHVDKSCSRVARIMEGCGFVFWSDISASGVTVFLGDLRTGGLSIQTSNYYLTAFKSFCKWMVKDGRASQSPVAHLDRLNANTDRRLVRRPLGLEEILWLLDVTGKAPSAYGMAGPERAMLYRLAIETGLRRGELASLTRTSFHLAGKRLTVTVEAAYSKHRREDVLTLRTDTARALADLLARRMPQARAFNMPERRHDSAAMFREDLASARSAWIETAASPQERRSRQESTFLAREDAAGRVVDFHALRHTAGSLFAGSGVHPKIAQTMMRHSTIELTMNLYTHVLVGQVEDAVAALPDLSAPPDRSARATGTDD